MNINFDVSKPQIKDMPIADAIAFMESGWKAMPFINGSAQNTARETTGATVENLYKSLFVTAKHHPTLQENFAHHALAFIENHPNWTSTMLFDLLTLAHVQPKIAPAAIDAAFDALISIENLGTGWMSREVEHYIGKLSKAALETAQQTGTTAHLIQKGIASLPASVNGAHYVIANTLFNAAKGNVADIYAITNSVRGIMPAIMEQSIHNARYMTDLTVEHIGAHPDLLPMIMEEADNVLQAIARAHPGEDYATHSIEKMLDVAKDNPDLRRQVVRMGQDAIAAGLEKSRYTSERMFHILYQAGKDDPALLPDLIGTAWQSVLPNYGGGQRSQVIQDLVDIGRDNPDARDAHRTNARNAIFNIATGDKWHIGGGVKILRDALGIENDRRVLSESFAMIKTGAGKNTRETWFIPKDGDTLVIQGTKISSVNDVAKKGFENADRLAQLGRIASAVFYDEITPDEGRREIRKTTGLRFETLR